MVGLLLPTRRALILPPNPITVLDAATLTAGDTLDATNLIVQAVGGASAMAFAQGLKSRSAGKYYFEMKAISSGSPDTGFGIITAGAGYPTVDNGTNSALLIQFYSRITVGATIALTLTSIPNNTWIGMAVDLDNKLMWWVCSTWSNQWNQSGTANPATSVGGVDISSMTFPVRPLCGTYEQGLTTNSAVANFGQNAFNSLGPPAGFTLWRQQ